jgi:hypothetical protein
MVSKSALIAVTCLSKMVSALGAVNFGYLASDTAFAGWS